MATESAFGDRVVCSGTLHRVRDRDQRRWERLGAPPFEALVIGWRTLSDGRVTGGGAPVGDEWYPDPVEYKPARHFKAYLVVRDERATPVLVLPEDLTPAPKETDPA